MTGRQLLRRPGYEIDVDRILVACAAHGVAVEINANPWRLDLDWRWHQRALELGCMMSINPDALGLKERLVACERIFGCVGHRVRPLVTGGKPLLQKQEAE